MLSQLAIIAAVLAVAVAAYVYRGSIARMIFGGNVRVVGGDSDDSADNGYENDVERRIRDSEEDVYGYYDDAETYGGGPFRLRVSDPEYTALLEGKKSVEARLDRAPFSKLKAGDPVVVVRARPKGDTSEYPGGKYKHEATVVRVTKHASLEALLKAEGVGKVYPGKTNEQANERFGAYLPPGTSGKDPVLAIELKAEKAKPAKK